MTENFSYKGVFMNGLRASRIKMIFSMLVFGTISLFVKNISLEAQEKALYRAILAFILIGLYLLVKKQKFTFTNIKRELPLLILSGAAMGVNWLLFFAAFNYTSVSVATLSYYFAPVIVTLACPVIFKERMKTRHWVCFFMASIGMILITGFDINPESDNFVGILLGLGAACLYSVVIILNKLVKGVDNIQKTFIQFASATVVLLPYVILTSGINISSVSYGEFSLLLFVGLFHTGFTYCVYFSAMKGLSGQETAILSYIDPLVAVLVSLLILKEQMTLLQIIGGIIILAFTLWNELSSSKDELQ